MLHDVLANIHDIAVLEKHPINEVIPRPDPSVSHAENLRRYIWDGIAALKPSDESLNLDSLEWRYYLILSGRYVEGASIQDIQKRLALGPRQERRLHGRALSALHAILWDRLFPDATSGRLRQANEEQSAQGKTIPEPERDNSFQVSLEPLHLDRVVQEVASLCLPRVQSQGGNLVVQIAPSVPLVQADRIILRQILLELFNCVLQRWAGGEIVVIARPNTGFVLLEIQAVAGTGTYEQARSAISKDLFMYWVERLNARLAVERDDEDTGNVHDGKAGQHKQVRYVLELPCAKQTVIVVVDDHEPAIRIVQRYLSQTNIQVVGTTEPVQVLSLARAIHPQAVLLDVMMPSRDGWEVLQALKSDPETFRIPVLVCSVWDQPDLAYSLGANGFLKKPINQAALLDELARINLLDISGGSLPTNS